jgi:hypothetical protein
MFSSSNDNALFITEEKYLQTMSHSNVIFFSPLSYAPLALSRSIHQVSYSIVEAKIQQAYKLFKDFSG